MNRRTLGRVFVGLFVLAAPRMATPLGAGTLDFDALPSGTFVTNQTLTDHGIWFPNGVTVQSHAQARSRPNLAFPPLDGEFRRQDIVVRFSGGQSLVSLAFQASQSYGSAYAVTLRAYDFRGTLVDSRTVTFVADRSWRTLTVGIPSGPEDIYRVVLTGGRASQFPPTNFLFVDDLDYSRAPSSPLPDTAPPYVAIRQPEPGAVLVSEVVPVEAEASEFNVLQAVTGTIVHLETGREVGRMDYCGSAASGACPDHYIRELFHVSLDPALEGEHSVSVTACDAAANCATTGHNITIHLPPPPAEVFVERVEINQGVQPDVFLAPPVGSSAARTSSVPLLGGRDTVVRFYPLAVGEYRRGYSARMAVRIHYRDGSTRERFTGPNAGVSFIDVAPDMVVPEARENVYLLMRADRSRTLNYVVPGVLLADANLLEVRLEDPEPRTGWLRVRLEPEVRLVVKHMRAGGAAIGGTDEATPREWTNALRYVEETLPVSEMLVIETPSVRIAHDDACEVSSSVLSCAVWQFSFFDPPGIVPASTKPTHLMKVGRIPYDRRGPNGIALWGSVLSKAYGDTYSHEIGHTLGRPHAGGFHGEAGGEEWPFPHGHVGATDFGVITDAVTPPGPFDLGRWDLTVVDPCWNGSVAARLPSCTIAGDQATHDLMSYGDGAADMGPLNLTSRMERWISHYTWNRAYERLRSSSIFSSASGTARAAADAGDDPAARVDALLIDGVVDGAGVQPLPVLRLSVPPADLKEPPPGPYSLELYGQGHRLLLSRTFDIGEMYDVGEGDPDAPRLFMMGQLVPYVPDLDRVVVRKDGKKVLDRKASKNPPTARMVHPNGGEAFDTGVQKVLWTVDDADGDRVLSRIEYSSDGGRTWGTLGMVGSTEPSQLEIDVKELPPSADARFRITASDGFRTTTDESDCPVAVGVPEPVECGPAPALQVGVDVRPGSSRCIDPDHKGSIRAAVLGAADLDVATVDASSLVLAGLDVRMRGDGSAKCVVKDVSGGVKGQPTGAPDGFPDLVCRFRMDAGAWRAEDGVAVLLGRLQDGTPITGTDTVCVVPRGHE